MHKERIGQLKWVTRGKRSASHPSTCQNPARHLSRRCDKGDDNAPGSVRGKHVRHHKGATRSTRVNEKDLSQPFQRRPLQNTSIDASPGACQQSFDTSRENTRDANKNRTRTRTRDAIKCVAGSAKSDDHPAAPAFSAR